MPNNTYGAAFWIVLILAILAAGAFFGTAITAGALGGGF